MARELLTITRKKLSDAGIEYTIRRLPYGSRLVAKIHGREVISEKPTVLQLDVNGPYEWVLVYFEWQNIHYNKRVG